MFFKSFFNQMTPLDIAESSQNIEIINYLKSINALHASEL